MPVVRPKADLAAGSGEGLVDLGGSGFSASSSDRADGMLVRRDPDEPTGHST
jgi:hypothetical protein